MIDWPWNRNDVAQIWKWPHVFWLNIFGWWAEEARTEIQRRWLKRYRRVINVYQTVLFTSVAIAVVLKFLNGNITEKMFLVLTGSSLIAAIVKLYNLITFRKTIKSIMDFIDEMFRQVRDVEEETIVRNSLKRCWILFICYLTMGSCVTLHWVLRPIIIAIVYGEKTRIFDSWPIYIDTWSQFAASFAFQLVGIASIAHALYLYDNFFFCITELILCQFTLLKHRLNKVRLERKEGNSMNLIQCIQFHAKLMRACTDLRNSSKDAIIVQSMLTVLGHCSGIYILTMTEGADSNLLINILEFAVLLTIVLYLYSWYCNEIKFQCQDVRNFAFMMDWINGTDSNKKYLLLLMIRTEIPVLFGGILDVDLNFFLTVFKATFSYYNFLVGVTKSNSN